MKEKKMNLFKLMYHFSLVQVFAQRFATCIGWHQGCIEICEAAN